MKAGNQEMFTEIMQDLLKRIQDRRPVTTEVNGQPYAVLADGTLGEEIRPLAPIVKPTLDLRTVSGLIAAFKAGLDELPTDQVAFVIASPTAVMLESIKADDHGHRHIYGTAKHDENTGFQFGKYYTPEEFLIAFRAGFLFNEMAVKVQTLCSSLNAESSVAVADDGMSQVVTVKQGAISRTAVELPNEIPLIPWRTFREVAPVESKFLLRMKAVKDSLPHIAIFEIDGKWKLDTITSISTYIADQVPGSLIIA
jgi:hypothetical protein